MRLPGRDTLYSRPYALCAIDVQRGRLAFPQARLIDRLFSNYPVLLAHEAELGTAGQFLATTLHDTLLLLTRLASGTLACHLNVCRHRGSQLLTSGSGCVEGRFTGRYHGWSYEPDSKLVYLPDHRRNFPRLPRDGRRPRRG